MSDDNITTAENRLTYISRNYKGTDHGGAKARVDMEDILADMGAVNLGLQRTFHSNKIIDFTRNLYGIVHYISHVKRGDIIVLQYPVKKYYRLICKWARNRSAKTITLVHDLGSFRRHRLTPEEEIHKLELSDVIIAANNNTAKWLREQGLTKPITTQVVWDFLTEVPAAETLHDGQRDTDPVSCLFVGHLKESKNGFLYKLPTSINVDLYGAGAPAELPAHIHDHGMTKPDEIIRSSKGRYGIIWYGSTLTHDPDGYIGEYIRYCNPHKLALYMLAGKPVIIWKHSGEAQFVEKEGIGITLESLEHLDKVLYNITEEQYDSMMRNVARVGMAMSRGHYFRQAFEKAIALLSNE